MQSNTVHREEDSEPIKILRRHLMAQAMVLSFVLSTIAVPAIAATPSSNDSIGIFSVIRRVLERQKKRPPEDSSQFSFFRNTSSKEIEALHYRVFDRRTKRQESLSDASKEPQKVTVPWESSLRKVIDSRYEKNISRQRERKLTAQEELLNKVEQRKQLRLSEQSYLQRKEEEAESQRRIIQSQREKRANELELQKKRAEERRELREKRADEAAKRDQYDELRIAMLKAINRERVNKNFSPLIFNKDLEMAAQLHAEDMLIRDYFDHFTPEGLSHVDRIKNIGYANIDMATCNCTTFKAAIGENIASGQRSVNWAMNELMESPSHRKNILSGYFKEIGIGISGNIWVQNFGGIEYTPR